MLEKSRPMVRPAGCRKNVRFLNSADSKLAGWQQLVCRTAKVESQCWIAVVKISKCGPGGLPIGAPDSISASAVLARNSDRIRRFGVEHDPSIVLLAPRERA